MADSEREKKIEAMCRGLGLTRQQYDQAILSSPDPAALAEERARILEGMAGGVLSPEARPAMEKMAQEARAEADKAQEDKDADQQ